MAAELQTAYLHGRPVCKNTAALVGVRSMVLG